MRQLRKAYKDVIAVDGLDLECGAGVLWPAGRTARATAIEICRAEQPDSGDVRVSAVGDVSRASPAPGNQLETAVEADDDRDPAPVPEFLSAGPPLTLVGVVQLGEKRQAHVGALSGGKKQRLAWPARLPATRSCSSSTNRRPAWIPGARQLWDLITGSEAPAHDRVDDALHGRDGGALRSRQASIMADGARIAAGLMASVDMPGTGACGDAGRVRDADRTSPAR